MSSLTISTIVCGDVQPSFAGSGLKTCTLACPFRRRAAKRHNASAAPHKSSALRRAMSLGGACS